MKGYNAIPLLLAIVLFSACQSGRSVPDITDLPDIKPAPEYSFVNYDGSTVSDEDFHGSVYIAYFFFTSCGGPCPKMNSQANVLQAEYADAKDFRIVGFSVDPHTDSVERLARYAERYNAQVGRWYMMRNEKEVVAELASKGFMVGDADVPALHSTRFVLVDQQGTIRGYYDGLDKTKVDELRAAIDYLLEGERS
ncbi:MAG: SCO family protein [Ignavibacteria bacterium]|nr:MAG: SCO family protein [Ignavibacteria bacterium]